MNLTMIPKLMLASLLAASLVAVACSGNDGDDTPEPTGDQPADRCPTAPAMELAVPRDFGGGIEGTDGAIATPGEVDFYRLTLDAPTFVRIATVSAPVANEDNIPFDPVLSVYNSDGTELLATANDAFNWGTEPTLDAEVLYNVPEATTLCVAVEDLTSWINWDVLAGQADFSYQVNASEVAKNATYVVDAGDNNTIATAQELDMPRDDVIWKHIGVACGTFDDANDVDIYTIDSEIGADIIVNGYILQDGPGASGEDAAEGTGSTLADGRISRLDSTNTDAYYSSVRLTESRVMESPADDGTVYLQVEPPEGAALGANGFYCLHLMIEAAADVWNPIEGVDAGNDRASAVSLEDTYSAKGFALIKGEISDSNDEDYYSFNVANTGIPHALVCGSKFKGSGLIDATFQIQNSQGGDVRTGIETDSLVIWSESDVATDGLLTIPDSGVHYLKVSAASQDPDILSTSYTCRLQTAD